MHGPDLRSPEARGQRRADSRTRAPRARITTPGTFAASTRRAGPIRIREDVQVRQRRALQIRGELLEVLVRFPGKADDDVGSDRGVRDPRANASTSAA